MTQDENLKLQNTKYESFQSRNSSYVTASNKSLDILFEGIDTNKTILDAGCGDGIALSWFKKNGYKNVEGIDGNPTKTKIAENIGYTIYTKDLHILNDVIKKTYDVIYCSHTLEHLVNPGIVLSEFKKILNPDGVIIIIIPYPDRGPDDAHIGKFYLKTNYISDNAIDVENVFKSNGLNVEYKLITNIREVEIFLKLKCE